jgi:polysaccharide biosynthesis/export protein
MKRKAPDILLLANDILYIPDDKTKRLAGTTIERLAGFGSTTATGLIIYH